MIIVYLVQRALFVRYHFRRALPYAIAFMASAILGIIYDIHLTEYQKVNIYLLGGEPLLHPEIISIMELTRKCFPNKENVIIRLICITFTKKQNIITATQVDFSVFTTCFLSTFAKLRIFSKNTSNMQQVK